MAPQENHPRSAEIRALAGARALPPLLLVLYHYHEAHGYQSARWFDVFVSKGYLWVEFFFALSGFILVHVYSARPRFRYVEFLKARLSRLYPLHVFTLLLMLGMVLVFRWLAATGGYISIYDLPGYHPYISLSSFVGNLFLVQAWHVFPRLTWNGVSWFVSVEWFLCLIFPLYLWIARQRAWAGVSLVVFGLLLLRWLIQPKIGLDITYDWGIPRGIGDFAVGVGLAMLYRASKSRADAWPTEWHSLVQLLSFAAFFYAVYATGWAHTMRDYWVLPPMFAIVLVLAFDRGFIARIFQSAPLRLLGEWSFAIYMGQTTFLQLLRVAEQRLYPSPAPQWRATIHLLEPAAMLILCISWGALLYYFVERPASEWLRRHWLAHSGRTR
ncbi:MAG TPA: acyltransferase [Rhizomicrobium sp.]|nr:acyltransferase [Rhizomicrobium sp.]